MRFFALALGKPPSQILSSLKLASWVFLSLCLFLFHKSSLESAVHPLAYNCLPVLSHSFPKSSLTIYCAMSMLGVEKHVPWTPGL